MNRRQTMEDRKIDRQLSGSETDSICAPASIVIEHA